MDLLQFNDLITFRMENGESIPDRGTVPDRASIDNDAEVVEGENAREKNLSGTLSERQIRKRQWKETMRTKKHELKAARKKRRLEAAPQGALCTLAHPSNPTEERFSEETSYTFSDGLRRVVPYRYIYKVTWNAFFPFIH